MKIFNRTTDKEKIQIKNYTVMQDRSISKAMFIIKLKRIFKILT